MKHPGAAWKVEQLFSAPRNYQQQGVFGCLKVYLKYINV